MIKKRYATIIVGFLLIFVNAGLVGSKEPNPPNVSKVLSPKKEARILQLEKVSVNHCYEQLKETEFLLDDDFSGKAAYRCFKNRKQVTLRLVMDKLKNAPYTLEGENIVYNDDLYVAKIVSKVFSADAEVLISNEYKKSTAQTKANMLMVLGQMSGNRARAILTEALNDQSAYEEDYAGMEGIPLRICDMAYNQLRLRYADELVDLPRTIGNPDRIEKRDFYVADMKGRL